VIDRLQRERQAQLLNGGFDAGVGQKLNQKPAHRRGAGGMARQNLRQEDRKGFSAPPAPAAIRTEDPLTSRAAAAIIFGGIVAVEEAVPVQCFILAAAWTALRLERKSSSFSFPASATKRKDRDMERVAAGTQSLGRDNFDGAADGATRLSGTMEKRRTALTALWPR
jgi:hypothetical protein